MDNYIIIQLKTHFAVYERVFKINKYDYKYPEVKITDESSTVDFKHIYNLKFHNVSQFDQYIEFIWTEQLKICIRAFVEKEGALPSCMGLSIIFSAKRDTGIYCHYFSEINRFDIENGKPFDEKALAFFRSVSSPFFHVSEEQTLC